MPTWLKVTLIVIGVIIVLVLAVGIGGYLWWKSNGDAMVADAKAAMDEGRRFAAGKDSWACVDEGAKRTKDAGLSGAIATRLFLDTCLQAARLAPGFCDAVPAPTDFLKAIPWQAQMNKKYGLNPPFETVALPQSIQGFCAARSTAPQP
jgi:hypothetical protein